MPLWVTYTNRAFCNIATPPYLNSEVRARSCGSAPRCCQTRWRWPRRRWSRAAWPRAGRPPRARWSRAPRNSLARWASACCWRWAPGAACCRAHSPPTRPCWLRCDRTCSLLLCEHKDVAVLTSVLGHVINEYCCLHALLTRHQAATLPMYRAPHCSHPGEKCMHVLEAEVCCSSVCCSGTS